MLDDILLQAAWNLPAPLLSKAYFFHDVRVLCKTNHPAVLAIFGELLAIFPAVGRPRGEVSYSVLCYDHASQFPVGLPRDRERVGAVRLLTDTKLTYYRSRDHTTEYQRYTALPPINEAGLSVIYPNHHVALTQLERPERHQTTFLRRYVLLMALGQLIRSFGYEPCHAAAVTAPWDSQQGALIVGESGSGKTTLSLGCASTGYGLLGDDLILLRASDGDGTIHAHTIMREVAVRSGSLDLWHTLSFLRALPADRRDKRYCAIERVWPGTTRFSAPIRLILFPSLGAEKESRLAPLSKARTLQELMNACLSRENAAQEKLFSLLSALVAQAHGYRLSIAQGATDGPQMIRSLFTGGPP